MLSGKYPISTIAQQHCIINHMLKYVQLHIKQKMCSDKTLKMARHTVERFTLWQHPHDSTSSCHTKYSVLHLSSQQNSDSRTKADRNYSSIIHYSNTFSDSFYLSFRSPHLNLPRVKVHTSAKHPF